MRKALLYLLTIATAAGLLVGAAVAAQSTQVLVVPPSSSVAPGATVTVEVQVRDVSNLYGADLQLAFDPAVLEVEDADGDAANGTQITAGNLLSSVYMFAAINRADNTTGQIRYMVSLLSPAAPVSGGGVLASVTFRARDPGSSTLTLQVLLADSEAGYIAAVVGDGLIVVSGDTATPTPTTTATRTPTRTPTLTALATATRTGTPPTPDHFLWVPLLLRAHWVPTLTPLLSATPTPTPSALPSATSTLALTPSPSPTGSITPVATRSPTPTPTVSRVASVTASATPTVVATPSPTLESRQLLLNPGFETDAAWVLEGGVQPVYTMVRAHRGVRSMRLGLILPQSQSIYSSVRQDVDLPDHIAEARLSLYYFPAGWPEDTDHLYLYVTRASDGATLFSDSWMQWEQSWQPYTVDLSSHLQPYAGQRVRLRVGVYNNGDGMTAVYVDDVEFWVMSGE